MKPSIEPPDLDDVLNELKNNIFANLNCIQIGKIFSINKTEQTAEVELMVKRRVEDKIISYPLLVDCPLIVSQGGGAYIDFPVSPGDYCLVLFNDRDIDNWWISENQKEPRSFRKHNLSDGFVLVGINSKINVLSLDGSNLDIWGPGGSDRIRITPTGSIEVGSNGSAAARVGDTTKLVLSPTDIVALATVLLATTAFVPTGNPPVPGDPLTFTGGDITGGSAEVTIK